MGRAMEEPPLEGIALGVGETIPRGIPPGETDLLAMAAPLEGDGARKLDVGGFNRDVGCRSADLSRRLESLVWDLSDGCGLRRLESCVGLGGARPLVWAARLGRLLLVTEEGGGTPPPPRRPRPAPSPPRVETD